LPRPEQLRGGTSVGTSKIPQSWMHANSAPERLTPTSRIGRPTRLTSPVPATRIPSSATSPVASAAPAWPLANNKATTPITHAVLSAPT
jgi:hypothetical protein